MTGIWITPQYEHHLICSDFYPSSVIPSTNSFLENSHCVAALNFQASMSTVILVGSNPASSQKRLTPSANILSSSTESNMKNIEQTCHTLCPKLLGGVGHTHTHTYILRVLPSRDMQIMLFFFFPIMLCSNARIPALLCSTNMPIML